MSRKLLFLASLIAVLAFVSNCWAGTTYEFTDANDILTDTLDGDWMDPCNWISTTGVVPSTMFGSPQGSSNVEVHVSYDDCIPYGGVYPVIDEDAGSIGSMKIGAYDIASAGISKLIIRSNGFLCVTREASVADQGNMLTGSTTGCPGHLIMTGGSLIFSNQYQFGKRAPGYVYMVSDDVNDNGGYPVLMGDRDETTGACYLKLGGANGGTGDAKLFLENGLVYGRGYDMYTDEAYANITAGTLMDGGNRTPTGYTSQQWLLYKYYVEDVIDCYSGEGLLNTVYDSPTDGWTTAWCDPRPPNCPGLISPTSNTVSDLLDLNKLIWDPGATADSHKLYLSTVKSEVNDRDAGCLKYTGAPNEYAIQSGDLLMGKTHYWRIVEYNDTCEVCVSRVLNFTIASCAAIEDFESYAGTSLAPYWDCDGINVAYVERQMGDSYYDNVTEGGCKSLCADYAEVNGSDNYGDIYFDPPNGARAEWTVGGTAFAVAFWYQAPATVEKIQIDIDGGGWVDCNAVLDGCWHQSNTRLSDLGGGPSDVDEFTIRLGDGNLNGHTSSQYVYIDDLAVCAQRCVPEFAANAGVIDYDADCDNDNWDMMYYDADWLLYDADRGAFDGNDGGVVNNNVTYGTANVNGTDMNVAIFDGNNDFIVMPGAAFANFNDKTQTLWVYYDSTMASDVDNNMGSPIQMGTAFNRGYLEMHLPDSAEAINHQHTIKYRAGHTNMQATTNFNFENTWVHIGMVRRVVCEGTQIELYVNGEFKDSDICPLHTDNREYSSEEEALGGNPQPKDATPGRSHFAGKLADYRVYDAALSAEDIDDIRTGSPPSIDTWLHYEFNTGARTADTSTATHIIPIVAIGETQSAESVGEKVLNFKDFDDFADSWADSFLWPQ